MVSVCVCARAALLLPMPLLPLVLPLQQGPSRHGGTRDAACQRLNASDTVGRSMESSKPHATQPACHRSEDAGPWGMGVVVVAHVAGDRTQTIHSRQQQPTRRAFRTHLRVINKRFRACESVGRAWL